MSKNPIERPADLTPVTEAELRQVEGGILVTGDGYCGTPWPGPRPLAVNVATISSYPIYM